MNNKQYNRCNITHRAAVRALENINKAISGTDYTDFWFDSYDNYDVCINVMANKVARLVAEVKEYRQLKEALRPIIGR